MHQIVVIEHHALGRAGRTRRVLQERQRIAADVRHFPLFFHLRGKMGSGKPRQLLEVRRFVNQGLDAFQHRGRRQGDLRLCVIGNRLDSRKRSIAARRIDRHRDHAGVQTAKERRDELQARRIQQQRPFADQIERLKPRGDRPRLPIQLPIGQVDLFVFSIDEVEESGLVRLATGAVPKEIHKRRGPKKGPR